MERIPNRRHYGHPKSELQNRSPSQSGHFLLVRSVTGEEPYLSPHSLKYIHGQAEVVLSANGVSSPPITFELHQLTPADGSQEELESSEGELSGHHIGNGEICNLGT